MLDINKMKTENRQRIEKEIVGQLVKDALDSGYKLTVSLERGYDIDEMLVGSQDYNKIMDEAFAGDDCHIFVQDTAHPDFIDGSICSIGWVYCVFGNDGWDVIADYTTNLEDLLQNANKISELYE